MSAPILLSWCPNKQPPAKCDPCSCQFFPTPTLGQDVDPSGSRQHLRFNFGDRPLCREKVALVITQQDFGQAIFGLNFNSGFFVTGGFPSPYPPVVHWNGSATITLLLAGVQVFQGQIVGGGTSPPSYSQAVESGQPIDSLIYVSPSGFAAAQFPNKEPQQQGFIYTGPYQPNSTWDLIFVPTNASGGWSNFFPSLFYAPL